MDLSKYNLITSLCKKYLIKKYHDRHLEDCIQYICMKFLEGRTNIYWNVIDYCRENGISLISKMSAKTLESSLSIDAPSFDSEDESNSEYLLNDKAQEIFVEFNKLIYQEDSLRGTIEEFLVPLNLNSEVLKWTINNYKFLL